MQERVSLDQRVDDFQDRYGRERVGHLSDVVQHTGGRHLTMVLMPRGLRDAWRVLRGTYRVRVESYFEPTVPQE